MRRAALLPLLALAVALVALAGCGSTTKDSATTFTGVKKDVAKSVDDMVTQAQKVDASKVCDEYFTVDLKNQLAARAKTSGRGTTCSDQLKDSLRDVDVFNLTVESIQVAGSSATVGVKMNTSAKHDPTGTLHMVDQRGWRISQLP